MQAYKRFVPIAGKSYLNKNGVTYRCLGSDGLFSVMQSTASGWTMKAFGIVRYEDGTIEWDYSEDGYFAGIRKGEME